MIINVIPSFGEIFSANDNLLPLPTRMLLNFSNFMYKNYIFVFLILLIILVIISIYHRRNPRTFHKLILKSKYYKMTKSLKFTFNMDLLLGAGLTVDRSLDIVSSMEDNVVLKEKFREILFDIKSGESFYKSANNVKIFPKILVSMIRVGEESSNLKEVFGIMSGFYDEELNSYNKKFFGILGPILIIFMALIIGFIVLSIALPVFDMVNQF